MVIRRTSENIFDHYYTTGIIGSHYDSKARMAIHIKSGEERVIKEVPKSQIGNIGDYMKKLPVVGSL